MDATRGSSCFTKLDLASSYHQLRVWFSDRWKTSFRSQLGQFDSVRVECGTVWFEGFFLMRVMSQALTVWLDYLEENLADGTVTVTLQQPQAERRCRSSYQPGSPGSV
jgi:hypothetical protein